MLASLCCMSSGEANVPMLSLSSTSENTGVVVASSPELTMSRNLSSLMVGELE